MRIIAGTYRGKKLFTPTNQEIRPTSDRARESIYNILNTQIGTDWEEVSLLDVCAGTGAFGLEAISRGVKEVCLIDVDTQLSTKNANLFAKEKAKIRILKANVLALPTASQVYDVVFLDAPYHKELSEKALKQLAEKGWLKPNALCVIEVEKKEDIELPEMFEKFDERRYGVAKIIFAKYIHK
ncbi:MAG: 16S rRNA (guanine(966)-N(2))-methyltransferase RsmD [Alphaproteobacteria bacterium]|nr:16S rRNA (guanine(966)-N(2))-methyltransferase RsmD [Alphaproteobacteria bacterium]